MRLCTSIAGRVFAKLRRKRKLLANRLGITGSWAPSRRGTAARDHTAGGSKGREPVYGAQRWAHLRSERCAASSGDRLSCHHADWGSRFREHRDGWKERFTEGSGDPPTIEGMARSLNGVAAHRACGTRPRGAPARCRDLLDLDLGASCLELLLESLGLLLGKSLLDLQSGPAPSTMTLASLRPRPVRPRTTLMTPIFLAPTVGQDDVELGLLLSSLSGTATTDHGAALP